MFRAGADQTGHDFKLVLGVRWRIFAAVRVTPTGYGRCRNEELVAEAVRKHRGDYVIVPGRRLRLRVVAANPVISNTAYTRYLPAPWRSPQLDAHPYKQRYVTEV